MEIAWGATANSTISLSLLRQVIVVSMILNMLSQVESPSNLAPCARWWRLLVNSKKSNHRSRPSYCPFDEGFKNIEPPLEAIVLPFWWRLQKNRTTTRGYRTALLIQKNRTTARGYLPFWWRLQKTSNHRSRLSYCPFDEVFKKIESPLEAIELPFWFSNHISKRNLKWGYLNPKFLFIVLKYISPAGFFFFFFQSISLYQVLPNCFIS